MSRRRRLSGLAAAAGTALLALGGYPKGTPAEVDLSEVDWDQSAARQSAEGGADGLSLNRIEDGAWDPSDPNDFYFVTTEGGDTTRAPDDPAARDGGGLWKLSFEDIDAPQLGATLTLLLDGSEAPYLNKPDNVDIDGKGHVLIEEDPGNNAHVARIVAYRIDDGARDVLATFDPALFAPGASGFITQDEESSGIIDAAGVLGRGWFLLDAQVHKANPDPELVEEGQLLAMKVNWRAAFGESDD
jgi:secreted PhoX family phosphatase